jgi:hypothetical protein
MGMVASEELLVGAVVGLGSAVQDVDCRVGRVRAALLAMRGGATGRCRSHGRTPIEMMDSVDIICCGYGQ